METIRLRHFKAIVDTGGLMKASEVLGITGGGLSKSIKSLEEELGFKLFQQQGRGLELTEIGQEEDDDEVKQLLVDVPDLKRAFHVMNKIGSGKTYSIKRQYLLYSSKYIHSFARSSTVYFSKKVCDDSKSNYILN